MAKIIGITGGSGSGKSTVVKRIKERYPNAVLIEMDIRMLSIWIL